MIMRRLLPAILLGSMLCGPALAGAGAPPSGAGRTDGPANVHVSSFELPNDLAVQAQAISDEFAPPETNYIDLPSMNVPVVRSGQLMGYAFIIVRVHLASNVDTWKVRDESHLILDAAVRAVHRAPFAGLGGQRYDEDAAKAAVRAVITEYLPGNGLESIELLGGDVRMLAR